MIGNFKSRLLIVPIMLIMIALFGAGIMLLWNVLMPFNTVLSRKHYAVKYLRKRLQELYYDIMGLSLKH